MAVLDPAEIQIAPGVQGRAIIITRPDGSVSQLLATMVERHHATVAIFFKDASSPDVPRGSELELCTSE